jgi:hypothetical protein
MRYRRSGWVKHIQRYFGAAVPIERQDVNEKHLKLENPNRANIMVTMKKKLSQLEAINAELMTKLDFKSRYDKIVEFLGKEKYFESEDDLRAKVCHREDDNVLVQ